MSKSAKHHWWPRSVSKYWLSSEGGIHWIKPNGAVKVIDSDSLGAIKNAHYIKLLTYSKSNNFIGRTYYGEFESEFQNADSNFPRIINYLLGLSHVDNKYKKSALHERVKQEPCNKEQLKVIVECVVSLVVRNPYFREVALSRIKNVRSYIPKIEEDSIISLNIRNALPNIMSNIGGGIRVVVLFSSNREFIYGDGLYSNITSASESPIHLKIVAPITPCISVLVYKTSRYTKRSVISTVLLDDDEVDLFNNAVQVYSKDKLYYRYDKPNLSDEYIRGEHLQYTDSNNPVDYFINKLLSLN